MTIAEPIDGTNLGIENEATARDTSVLEWG